MSDALMTPDSEGNAELFRVLGHETRLRLLLLLAAGERGVGELDAVSGIGQPGLSQQLAILRKARLVTTRRAAKQVYYRIDPDRLQRLAGLLTAIADAAAATGPVPQPQGTARQAGSAGSAARFARMLAAG
jgi:DNA-binding transcriptional ArsR family regulator